MDTFVLRRVQRSRFAVLLDWMSITNISSTCQYIGVSMVWSRLEADTRLWDSSRNLSIQEHIQVSISVHWSHPLPWFFFLISVVVPFHFICNQSKLSTHFSVYVFVLRRTDLRLGIGTVHSIEICARWNKGRWSPVTFDTKYFSVFYILHNSQFWNSFKLSSHSAHSALSIVCILLLFCTHGLFSLRLLIFEVIAAFSTSTSTSTSLARFSNAL